MLKIYILKFAKMLDFHEQTTSTWLIKDLRLKVQRVIRWQILPWNIGLGFLKRNNIEVQINGSCFPFKRRAKHKIQTLEAPITKVVISNFPGNFCIYSFLNETKMVLKNCVSWKYLKMFVFKALQRYLIIISNEALSGS